MQTISRKIKKIKERKVLIRFMFRRFGEMWIESKVSDNRVACFSYNRNGIIQTSTNLWTTLEFDLNFWNNSTPTKKNFMITMWFWSKRRRRRSWKKIWKRIATDHNDYMCQFWRKHFNTESYFYVKKQRIRCGYFLLNCEINDTVNAQFQSKWGMKKRTHTLSGMKKKNIPNLFCGIK